MAIIRPSFIDGMSWEMAEVYGAITDQILVNLARYFPYWKSGNVPKSAFEYQASMLAQMGQVNADTVRIIRNGLKGANIALSNCLEQAIMEAVSKSEPQLLKAVKEGILKPAGIPIVAPNQMRAYNLYYQQAATKLNLVNTVMLESTKDAYRATVSDIVSRVQATQTALDIGAGEVVTGVSSWNQALRHSIDRMKENGITGFIDHGGHQWSAEAYTAMDIRTTMANTARAAVWETNQDFGNDLYLVSYHNGARPLCYDWQNKVISSTDNARIVKDLDGNDIRVYAQSETTYGEPAGLFGINCKHYPTPFIPGVSVIYGEPQPPEENAKTYEESQKQRALEREIREQKRDLLMMKAQGAPEEEIRAQRARIRATDDKIDAFCEETGRARRQSREGVFTQRSFPDKDTYDVSTFESKQKDAIDKYFTDGGAQQGYTFGEMTPNTQGIEKTKEEKLKDIDREIEELKRQQSEVNKQMRFDDSDELKAKSQELTEKINSLYDKQFDIEREEKQKAKEIEKENEEVKRSEILEKYRSKIAELEKERFDLIASGSDDYVKSDELYTEVERLKKKLEVIEKGGYTIEEATKTREIVKTHWGDSIDADVYTMPDGKRFVFKRGMSKAHQSLTPEDLVDRYYTSPKKLRDMSQKEIIVIDRYNPQDTYWRKTYKNFKHSYMTGGETITIYRQDYAHDLDYLETSLRHEMGHIIDKMNSEDGTSFSNLKEWIDAIEKDKEFSGGIMESVSEYGKNSNKEDFAESVMKYVGSPNGFTAAFPHRAEILKRLIGVIEW